MRHRHHFLWRLTAILALLLAAPQWAALAQAQDMEVVLSTADPKESSFLTAAPTHVRLTFNNRVQLEGSSLSVIAPGGGEANGGPVRLDGDGRTLIVPLRSDLANGLYSVHWAAMPAGASIAAEGSFNFGLRVGAAAPTLRADRTRVVPGDAITLTGTQFKPRGSVVISIAMDDEFVDAGWADELGRVQQTVRIPHDVPSGVQTITMTDGDGASATVSVEVANSIASPIRVRMAATSRPEHITVQVTVLNRSGFDLRLDTIRLPIPAGASFLRATSGGRQISSNEVGWDNLRIRPGEIVGPLIVSFDTRSLPDATTLTIPAAVHFVHPAVDTPETARLMRFQNTMPGEVNVRVGGLD